MYLSAVIKRAGHECRLAIGKNLKDFHPVIKEFRPDMVGLSVMTGGHLWGKKIAGQVKRAYGIGNIFGGAHATFYPGFAAAEEVDLLVRGEGEETLLEILNRLDAGESFDGIPNISFKHEGCVIEVPPRPLQEHLDKYPFPDRSLYDILEGRTDRSVQCVLTARGCPYHCSYCFQDSMRELYKGKGKFLRVRSVEKVIAECRQLAEHRNTRVIYFADDVFGFDRRWLYEFLDVYTKEIALPFLCLARANIIAADENYAQRLADAGCQSVFFGIESGNERIRNEVLKKNLSDRDIYKSADMLHRAGIRFRTYNMLGLPDETLEDAFATLEMNVKIQADYPWCSIFTPYPGTGSGEYARQRGYLNKDFDYSDLSESFFVDSKLNLPQIREMENLQKFFQTAVLWPWMIPIIKRLIRLRPNVLFSLWFGFVYFIVYLRSEKRGFWLTLKFALANARHVM